MSVRFFDLDSKQPITKFYIVSRYQNQWVFCKYRGFNSHDIPHGQCEFNETIKEAAAREIFEDTGAIVYNMKPLCAFEVIENDFNLKAVLFYAEIEKLNQLSSFKIEQVIKTDAFPDFAREESFQAALLKFCIEKLPIRYGTELKRMLAGKLYVASNEELGMLHLRALKLVSEFNNSDFFDKDRRTAIIKELFGSVGGSFHIEPSIRCDYGFNIHIGDAFYANYDVIFLDVNKIYFGNNVYIAPRCCFYTAGHPIDKDIRNEQYEFGAPIYVGNDVWFGGSVVVNPGVCIGNNVVIGSGSVVTKDIPSNVVAAGNPCRVIRPITENDKEYWTRKKNEYLRDGYMNEC